ncbi:MAG TPA: hypothetical protein VM532_18385 [Burkholderiales bacterium]|nr:hypothetical protein [Burkholderiales bacterium]
MRVFYRLPVIEALLLASIALQVFTGLPIAFRRLKQRQDAWRRLQIFSGIYLAYFFINHVGATLLTRGVVGLDTNIFFASVGLHAPPFQYFFAPYYFLAVCAFFAHSACIVRNVQIQSQSSAGYRRLHLLILLAGPLVGGLIVAAQAGAFYPVTIQDEYVQAFKSLFH